MSDTPIMSWEQADQIMQDQRAEIARLRLTDAEREAIKQAAMRVECLCQRGAKDMAATLRGLLDRAK